MRYFHLGAALISVFTYYIQASTVHPISIRLGICCLNASVAPCGHTKGFMTLSMRLLFIISALHTLCLFAQVPPHEPIALLDIQFDSSGNILAESGEQFVHGRDASGCYKDVYQDGIFLERRDNQPCLQTGAFLRTKLSRAGFGLSLSGPTPTLSRAGFGSNIGAAALTPFRQTRDNRALFLASAASTAFGDTDMLYLFSPTGSNGQMEQVWSFNPNPGAAPPIRDLAVVDADDDGTDEVVTAHTNGTVSLTHAFTTEPAWTLAFSAEGLINIQVADFGWGEPTLLVRLENEVRFFGVLDPAVQANPLTLAGRGPITVANFDADADLEFLVADETNPRIHDLNGDLVAILPHPLGRFYGLADVTGDDRPELVVATDTLGYYDLTTHAFQTLDIAISEAVGAMTLADLNDDGKAEIILGSSHWDGIRAYDVTTLSQISRLNSRGYGVDQLLVAGDELFWSTGGGSTATDSLFSVPSADLVQNAPAVTPVVSPALAGPFTARATVHGENSTDLLVATQQGDTEGATVMLLDPITNTRRVLWTARTPNQRGLTVADALTANLDEDPALELALLVVQVDRTGLIVIDRDSGLVEFEHYDVLPASFFENPAGLRLHRANVSRFDGTELIVATNHGIRVYSWNSFLTLLQLDPTPGDHFTEVATIDPGDGGHELLAFTEGRRDVVLVDVDSPQREPVRLSVDYPRALHTVAATDSFPAQIAVGTRDGEAMVFSGPDFARTAYQQFQTRGGITAITAMEEPAGPHAWVIAGPYLTESRSNDLSAENWRLTGIDESAAKRLLTVDTNSNGAAELVLASRHGLTAWEFAACNRQTPWVEWNAGVTLLDLVNRINCAASDNLQ
ncbi:hypothetical protein [Acanthopleuribacter pedis]|uniref:VCBS repeat-containing protein n=1 Tax=Acanthopleuribacter pedis TaxID=442870 RepID=A0A8J7QC43_9BACT|nr:hypothetical protein [Acanthopleuribacter pedis]MBO1321384.1 hypothetical protein [Acanthopleuribacter pedis]